AITRNHRNMLAGSNLFAARYVMGFLGPSLERGPFVPGGGCPDARPPSVAGTEPVLSRDRRLLCASFVRTEPATLSPGRVRSHSLTKMPSPERLSAVNRIGGLYRIVPPKEGLVAIKHGVGQTDTLNGLTAHVQSDCIDDQSSR